MAQPIEAFRNAFKIPELKGRIYFTLIMLGIYRLGAHVPTPGIDGGALSRMIEQQGGLTLFYDMFSGGAFSNATVFALGIMPYISASIIMQLLVVVVPQLEKLQKEGAEGQKKITEYTRYGTIILCVIQSIMLAVFLQNLNQEYPGIVANPGFGFVLMCIISFTTGTAFIMWQGEQISEHGVGNGMSLIIFMSIVAGMPGAVMSLLNLFGAGEVNIVQILLMVAVMILVIAGVILVITGQRRIPVQYPRQVKGRRLTMGGRNYLPLRVNQAGVIPIIFASAILMLPGTLTEVITQPQVAATLAWLFNPMGVPYMLIYAGLIVFFTFFYTAVTFNPVDMADNLKKQGGVVMGVRPGRATAEYLNHVMTRVTVVGALFLAVVALIPQFILMVFDIGDFMIASYFGGTSLLILVGVALDTVRNVEQHLVMRNYDGFLKGGRAMPGRRR